MVRNTFEDEKLNHLLIIFNADEDSDATCIVSENEEAVGSPTQALPPGSPLSSSTQLLPASPAKSVRSSQVAAMELLTDGRGKHYLPLGKN